MNVTRTTMEANDCDRQERAPSIRPLPHLEPQLLLVMLDLRPC